MYLHLVKVLEDNYPEMMKRLYVINGKYYFDVNSLKPALRDINLR